VLEEGKEMIDWTDKALDAAIMAMGEGSYPRLSWGNRLKCREDFRKILDAAIEAQEAACEEFEVEEVEEDGEEGGETVLFVGKVKSPRTYQIDLPAEQIERIVIDDLKDAYRLREKYTDGNSKDVKVMSAIITVLEYYMPPDEHECWMDEIGDDVDV